MYLVCAEIRGTNSNINLKTLSQNQISYFIYILTKSQFVSLKAQKYKNCLILHLKEVIFNN